MRTKYFVMRKIKGNTNKSLGSGQFHCVRILCRVSHAQLVHAYSINTTKTRPVSPSDTISAKLFNAEPLWHTRMCWRQNVFAMHTTTRPHLDKCKTHVEVAELKWTMFSLCIGNFDFLSFTEHTFNKTSATTRRSPLCLYLDDTSCSTIYFCRWSSLSRPTATE